MRFEDELERQGRKIRRSTISGPDWVRVRRSALACFLLALGALYAGAQGKNGLELVLTFLAGACGAYSLLHLENRRLYVKKPPMDGQ